MADRPDNSSWTEDDGIEGQGLADGAVWTFVQSNRAFAALPLLVHDLNIGQNSLRNHLGSTAE